MSLLGFPIILRRLQNKKFKCLVLHIIPKMKVGIKQVALSKVKFSLLVRLFSHTLLLFTR